MPRKLSKDDLNTGPQITIKVTHAQAAALHEAAAKDMLPVTVWIRRLALRRVAEDRVQALTGLDRSNH